MIKRYNIVERTTEVEIRPEEQSKIRRGKRSKKAESCQESLWNEIRLKGP